MIRSLLARLTLLEQITTLVVIVAFGLLSVGISSSVMRAERRAFAHATAERLAGSIESEFADESDTLVVAGSLIDDGREVGVQVEVRDPAGRVIRSSPTRPPDTAGRSAPEGADTLQGTPTGHEFVATATSRAGFRVTVRASDLALRRDLGAMWRALGIAALPILALSLLFGRLVMARALRPLSSMAERAATISLERNPRSLGVRSGLSEIDRLSDSFDHLLIRLDDAMLAERRLTADASHELRTPLTVLGGELEWMLENATAGSSEAAGLARASDQVGAMRELVEAILLLHRAGEGGRESTPAGEVINLCDLARETLAEVVGRYPGRDGDARISAPDELLVSGQSALLGSAVRNLIDNALKFTSRGQPVSVDVSGGAGGTTLTVDDGGPGIPAAERERVFAPFYRGVGAQSGTRGFGLGLPLIRRVARAYGGDAEVGVSPLGGARFTLRLPGVRP